ncbi:cell division protein FtsN [Actinobacillus succinogenes]|uniref:Cell division protein FtsN n=1 Tax=Actinobacillus succinogenes (strain ATCC 55618 / DSM 22257 / CCUG 43843 / 130Z) TaxID=339671 RepID=A6VLQ6_ACTSZ|nr:cell division protein FtsN [Actinobacillus succinogenes]ABR73903.1 cell division protein FtsN [Actinobacillus succinogenes 130Z]PHI39648.1 cell division protein FtsN [Actinobacillus succinogenes]
MAQRDYAARSTKKKKSAGLGKSVLLTIACVVVLGFALGLYFLTTKAPEPQSRELAVEQVKPKSQLPSRPEESWSYIKELERRTVPTDNSQASLEKVAQLSEKQKEDLRRLEEAEKKAALERATKAAENGAQQTVPVTDATSVAATATSPAAGIADEAGAKAEAEKRAVEQAKKEEERKKAELAKQQAAKKAETAKSNSAKASGGKFGLQCGAFNDRAKAEALQAKLAMTGLNARITESGKWNRVLVGPIGDRQAAAGAQQQAGSVASCVIIGM